MKVVETALVLLSRHFATFTSDYLDRQITNLPKSLCAVAQPYSSPSLQHIVRNCTAITFKLRSYSAIM